MRLLSSTINTLPGTSSHAEGTEIPKSLAFVVYLGEGQEESQYLEMLSQGKENIIDVFKYYLNSQQQITLSHPNHRYKALIEFLESDGSDYSPYLDKAFLISDRDSQSFKVIQYDKMLENCENKGIVWIVSNPSFQLWLLLHFTEEIESLDLENVNGCKKQIEKIETQIKALSPKGYTHGTLNKSVFKPLVETAIKNSEPFCLSVKDLKENIGTNFSVLVKYILEK
ncbi:MAG: RloB domain-containing protein [Bacteroides sp.]|nr:RloB domain-containing protein [Bacteroides sp.]